MKKYSKNFLAIVIVSCVLTSSPASAITKLEATGPAADVVAKIQKVKEKIEDIQTKIMREKEKWTKKANSFLDKTTGTEGAALFKKYVVEPGAGIVHSAAQGQFNAGDFSLSGYTGAIKSQLGDYKLDYATLVAQSRDMIESAEKVKREKEYKISEEIVKLQAEWDAKNRLNAELKSSAVSAELDLIAARISNLKQQQTELSNKVIMESDKQKEMQEHMLALQQSMADYNSKISQDELLKKLNTEALSLFTLKMEEAETDALYSENIEKLFLSKYDSGTTDNYERIRKIRKEEYFKAEKNILKVIVDSYNSIEETQNNMMKCMQASTEAQALFGGNTMRVCVDIQIAKVAAQYMEMLVAQIHHTSSLEIQRWSDRFKLPDYSRDYTKFNLDDYVLTKDDLNFNLKNKISGAVDDTMMKFKGF